jgi:hypothetical protein
MTTLSAGDRFYYTGDMANQEGEGTIEAVSVNEWGVNYRLAFDDARGLSSVTPAAFVAGPGRRFWPLWEWQEDRARRIAEFIAAYAKTA